MHSMSPAGGRRFHAAWRSCRRRHHLLAACRRPYSLLWLALLAVATAPAASFVVPSSAGRLRRAHLPAAASPLPKFFSGTGQGLYGARNPGGGGDGDQQRRMHALLAPPGDTGEQKREKEKNVEDTESRRRNVVGACVRRASWTSVRNSRALGAVTALSAGKGSRAADLALRASATGMDLESRVSQAESRPKRILILMSDTGGGHRASSEALTAAMKDLYGDQVQEPSMFWLGLVCLVGGCAGGCMHDMLVMSPTHAVMLV